MLSFGGSENAKQCIPILVWYEMITIGQIFNPRKTGVSQNLDYFSEYTSHHHHHHHHHFII